MLEDHQRVVLGVLQTMCLKKLNFFWGTEGTVVMNGG